MTTQPYAYSTYGLSIESDFALPELPKGPGPGPRLSILRRPAPPAGSHGAVEFTDLGDRQVLFWAAVGSFTIVADDCIEVSPAEGVGDDLVALPLLGTVLAALLQRRGLFVLHASAVGRSGVAAGFLGDKGAGKSTTAAMLLAGGGYDLLADDVLAVDFEPPGAPRVIPGFGRLKLWRDSAAHVGASDRDSRPLPAIDKASYGMAHRFAGEALPLRRLYIIARGPSPGVEILPPAEAVGSLLRYSYMARFGEAGFGPHLAGHFDRAGRLAGANLVRRLVLPDGLGHLHAGIEVLRRDLEEAVPAAAI